MAEPDASAANPLLSVDDLLRRRAERLRLVPNASDDEAVLPVAEFRIGEESYAIPLVDFRAVLPLRLVTPVPLAKGHVIGVLRFEGRILRALSLASLLGARGWAVDPRVLLVVVGPGGELVALDCEQIPKPSAVPVAAVAQAKRRAPGAVLELTTRDLRQIRLIELDSLLREGGRRS